MGLFRDWDINFYSITFIAKAARNIYEGSTYSDQNLGGYDCH